MRKVHLIGVFCIMFSIFNLVACSNNIFADNDLDAIPNLPIGNRKTK